MPRLTGGEIVIDRLVAEGVPYFVGIPGHGALGLMDAALKASDRIDIIQVRHEQSAVHLADGYYRVSGSPLACFTSIGPGALNTAIGLGTCFVESTSTMVISGAPHTYMRGRGVLQEIERKSPADLPSALEPLVKKAYRPSEHDELFEAMEDAFTQMLTGRPGPVFLSLPMDLQSDAGEVPNAETRVRDAFQSSPDDTAVRAAAELLMNANRTVIVAGGGVSLSGAEAALLKLAEQAGAAVVTTLQAKGCFPEDHALYGWLPGSKGTSIGNALTLAADVILAVGCRFTDQTASSYRADTTFNIPESKLIQIDVDEGEIGKNIPVDVGIIGDARQALEALSETLSDLGPRSSVKTDSYIEDIAALRTRWLDETAPLRESDADPTTVPRFYKELRDVLARDAIVVTSSGHAQACVLEFPFYEPRTNITAGGFSTMGFAYPASLGAKLAAPEREVVAVVGDGDFMMTMQEMATAYQYGINTVVVVLNNYGWYSIRDLQKAELGEDRAYATDFVAEGATLPPDFVMAARAFGLHAEGVSKPSDIGPAITRALESGRPSLVEVSVARDYPNSGSTVVGWWDVPIPDYLTDRRAEYEENRAKEVPPPNLRSAQKDS
ncbi:MAG: thiamine pyrophosphate-binding protein [Chloroflexi bacterium]|nr:thiamine pyrophosphate-binding protein [Chloroflexota bacterium]